MVRPLSAAIVSLVIALAAPSVAAAVTRAEYDTQVNGICAATNSQSDALLRAFLKRQHKIGKRKSSSQAPDAFLDKASRRLSRKQSALFAAELAQLQAVPAATGDEATVAGWLGIRAQEVKLGTTIHAKQRKNEKGVEARIKTAAGRAKQRKLDKALEKLLKQARDLAGQDSALSTQLGATSCFPSANGEAIGSFANEG